MEDNINNYTAYTTWSQRKTFIDEWYMVRNICGGTEDLEIMRSYLMTLVPIVANQFEHESHPKPLTTNIFGAAYMYLFDAIKTYYVLKINNKIGIKFSTYYEWFMRQGFQDYPENKYKNKDK